MKYALVDTQATVHFRYLVALEENESLTDAESFVDQNELDDLVQCWGEEIINSVKYADDTDIEKAIKGTYMENWGIRQIKEVFCVGSKQDG